MKLPLNIDWQQILLHLFNLVILAGGLYLLLYKPVHDFMEKRKNYYEEMDAKAEEALKEAEKTKRLYETKLSESDEEIRAIKRDAEKAAGEAREKAVNEAREEADRIVAAAKENARITHDRAMQEAEKDIRDLAVKTAEKLVRSSVGESYDDFLDAAERS